VSRKPQANGGRRPAILAVRLSSLGDLVLALPALAAIKAKYPGSRLAVLTKASYAPLLSAVPVVDQVLLADSGHGLGALARTARRVRAEHFAGAFDLHAQLRSRAILVLAGVPVWGRVDTRPWARRALVLEGHARRILGRDAPPGAARGAGIPLSALAMARAVDPAIGVQDLELVELELPPAAPWPAAPGKLRIALCPGARHATKAWPGFAVLASLLLARGESVRVILGPGDRWDSSAAPGATVVTGELLQVAAALRAADLAIGNDSGLTHLAVAAGTPALVLFGPTVPALGFLPVGSHCVVERPELGCRPCAVHGGERCPRGDHACLAEITAASVFSSMDGWIGAVHRLGRVHAG
jgi:ADP-heptose:LPS heptosyltransferase